MTTYTEISLLPPGAALLDRHPPHFSTAVHSWTVELGHAFIQQPSELMDAIQSLRAKAQSVGTLQTTPQQVVVVTNAVVERTYETQIVYVTNTVVQIIPANPQVIYVPVYSPTVVYYPPPAYVYNPMAPLIVFGAGIAAGVIIANNHCNWYYGGVYRGPSGVVVWGGSGYGRYPYYPPPPHYRPPPVLSTAGLPSAATRLSAPGLSTPRDLSARRPASGSRALLLAAVAAGPESDAPERLD